MLGLEPGGSCSKHLVSDAGESEELLSASYWERLRHPALGECTRPCPPVFGALRSIMVHLLGAPGPPGDGTRTTVGGSSEDGLVSPTAGAVDAPGASHLRHRTLQGGGGDGAGPQPAPAAGA